MNRARRPALVVAAAAATAAALLAPGPLAAGAAPALRAQAGPQPVATGLDNPRQLTFSKVRHGAERGALYVAEAGTGGDGPCIPGPEGEDVCIGRTGAVTRVKGGHQHRVLTRLPSLAPSGGGGAIGPSDVHLTRFKRMAVTVGMGADPQERDFLGAPRLATVLTGRITGGVRQLADVGEFEIDRNPHPTAVDSNPTALLKRGRSYVVVDAGGNSIVQLFPGGGRKLLAVFEDHLVPGLPGLPDPFPVQAVPTSIAVGPDGAYYVSQLTGFPFLPGEASIFRMVPGEEPTVYASGLTNVTDLAWRGDQLYAVQIADAGLAAPTTGPPVGSVRKVTPGGSSHEALADGLPAPYGVALRGGHAFVTTCAVCPGAGEIWKLPLS